jgi:hypothetical protein
VAVHQGALVRVHQHRVPGKLGVWR